MRTSFFVLALVNLIFLVWSQGFTGKPDSTREPERLGRQVLPDRVSVTVVDPAARETLRASCRRITGIPAMQAENLRLRLRNAGFWADTLLTPQGERFRIVLTTNSSKAVADRRAEDLRRMGLTDFRVRFISGIGYQFELGNFDRREDAKNALNVINQNGLWSPRIVRSDDPSSATLEVRANSDLLQDRLPELLSDQKSADVTSCP